MCFVLKAQGEKKMTRAQYIEKYKDYAIKEMERAGIPASITLAQGLLESGDGNSRLARNGNNHFGIKCHNWKGGEIRHDDDEKNECFRKYNSAYESYRDHSDFLTSTSRYSFLFELDPTDYKGWAKGLKKAGYATSPVYAEALIKIIEENKLFLYDKGINIPKKSSDKDKQIETTKGKRETFENNRVKYIVVKEGETLESITRELGMLPWELNKYNDLPKNYNLTTGQSIYIQPKRNKAEAGKNTHIVKEGETFYTISQMYAIKLSWLYKRNNMNESSVLQSGIELKLRGRPKAGNKTIKVKKTEPQKIEKPAEEKPEEFTIEESEEMIFELDPD